MTQATIHMGVVDGQIKFQSEKKTDYNNWLKGLDNPDEVVYDKLVEPEPLAHALSTVKKHFAKVLEFTGCSRIVVLLTKGGDCFRHNLATIQKYKGNRDKLEKPLHYDAIREYMMTYYDAKMYNKWEADDAACMALHAGSGKPNVQYIMSAIDKDLYQMPGLHLNPSKKDEGVYVVSESEGWYNFYIQMLCGDVADNIKGLKGTKGSPGISEAKAHKLLAGVTCPKAMCAIVWFHYQARYGAGEFEYTPWWEDLEKHPDNEFHGVRPAVLTGSAYLMFRENADLLYMLRTPDDQYLPHCKELQELWVPYPKGTVVEFLGE
jgi:hypothetical protein